MLFWPVMIIGVAVLGLLLSQPAPDAVVVGGHINMRTVYLALLAAALVIASVGRLLLHGGYKTLIHTAGWLGAIAGLAAAFSYREQATVIIEDVRAALSEKFAPSEPPTATSAVIPRKRDGHYLAVAEVNGVEMNLMVDTGASMVLIPYEQAAALGIDVGALDFSMPVVTANGDASVAPIRLSSIRVQHVAAFDVQGAVAQPGRLKTGLLGMSFLEQLTETSFRGDKLILRQGVPRNVTPVPITAANN
jgi:aspartyl protease family protein